MGLMGRQNVRLNLGCGPLRREGEIGVDFMRMDGVDVLGDVLTLPIRSACATFVRLDHVLEHMPYRMAPRLLGEAYRVLMAGGTVRIGVPNVLDVCKMWIKSTDELTPGVGIPVKVNLMRHLFGSQTAEGQYHLSGWDPQTLTDLLGACGFTNVCVRDDVERAEAACIVGEAIK